MNPGLLNIWRENGANLRFGETKNLIVSGVSTALLAQFLQVSQSGTERWFSYQKLHDVLAQGPVQTATLMALVLSIIVSIVSVFPNVSGRYIRVRITLAASRLLGIVPKRPKPGRTAFFIDVTAYHSAEDYGAALLANGASQTAWTIAELDLIEQIWVVCRIATMKFALFCCSTILTTVAAIMMLISGFI